MLGFFTCRSLADLVQYLCTLPSPSHISLGYHLVWIFTIVCFIRLSFTVSLHHHVSHQAALYCESSPSHVSSCYPLLEVFTFTSHLAILYWESSSVLSHAWNLNKKLRTLKIPTHFVKNNRKLNLLTFVTFINFRKFLFYFSREGCVCLLIIPLGHVGQ